MISHMSISADGFPLASKRPSGSPERGKVGGFPRVREGTHVVGRCTRTRTQNITERVNSTVIVWRFSWPPAFTLGRGGLRPLPWPGGGLRPLSWPGEASGLLPWPGGGLRLLPWPGGGLRPLSWPGGGVRLCSWSGGVLRPFFLVRGRTPAFALARGRPPAFFLAWGRPPAFLLARGRPPAFLLTRGDLRPLPWPGGGLRSTIVYTCFLLIKVLIHWVTLGHAKPDDGFFRFRNAGQGDLTVNS